MKDMSDKNNPSLEGNCPILKLEGITKLYPSGEEMVAVLKNVNLEIYPGEMVAIIGPSGSGKSTLMNILGCLDNASEGKYYVAGQDVSTLDMDALARFRRHYYGFIFQRYHLLSSLNAVGNVEIPAIYSGLPPAERRQKAFHLLKRLGMEQRVHHRPNQLSGGQQQRVSIARALMNGGDIILADEPTGALDQQSGNEVLKILDELHQEGRTIILVTHDSKIAARAERIIEIKDGCIIKDERNPERKAALSSIPSSSKVVSFSDTSEEKPSFFPESVLKVLPPVGILAPEKIANYRMFVDRLWEAFRMAIFSLKSHPMRTFLTMLGIIIGIAAVISMVALGNGVTQRIMNNLGGLSANTLTIFPGKSMSARDIDKITTLSQGDIEALSGQPYVMGVTPLISFNATVTVGSLNVPAIVSGAGSQIFSVHGLSLVEGRFFTPESERSSGQEVVVSKDSLKSLFPNSHDSPLNKIIVVGSLMMRIVGVYEESFKQPNKNVQLYIPYSTAQTRFFGASKSLSSITVRVKDKINTELAQAAITRLLTIRHGTKDFFILNMEEFRNKIMSSFQILALFVSAIAVIALLVGGIGVMNIMLVTVSERTNEIGVRMAVGARRGDILQQFLIEAVVVCLLGGALGVALSMFFGWVLSVSGVPIPFLYTFSSIFGAVFFSSLIGIGFGFLPARNASRLTPVEALARD